MDRTALRGQRRLHERLRQRGMGVDREVELLEGEPVLDREGGLGDEVGGAGADDVGAQQRSRSGVGDDLDEAFALSERERASRSGKREAAHLDLDPALPRLLLAQSDMRDLRVCVDAVWRGVVVGCPAPMPCDVLDGTDAFVRGDVRQHDAADHVADRPHSAPRRAQLLVDDDSSALELDAGSFNIQSRGVRAPAHCEQHLVCVDRAPLAPLGEAHLQAALRPRDLSDLAVGVHLRAEACEVLGVDAHEVGVDHGQDLGQHLEHGDLAAERRKHGGELHSDHPASDHGQPGGNFFELEDGVGVDGQLNALQRDAGHRLGRWSHRLP